MEETTTPCTCHAHGIHKQENTTAMDGQQTKRLEPQRRSVRAASSLDAGDGPQGIPKLQHGGKHWCPDPVGGSACPYLHALVRTNQHIHVRTDQHTHVRTNQHLFRDTYMFEPISTYMFEPINTYMFEPINTYMVEPINTYMFEPINTFSAMASLFFRTLYSCSNRSCSAACQQTM